MRAWKGDGGCCACAWEQYLFRNNCGRQAGTPAESELTIGELNRQLDRLARSDAAGAGQGAAADAANRAKAGEVRVGILRHLLRITTPRQMRWIVQLILRELKASQTQLLSKDPTVDLSGVMLMQTGVTAS